MNPSSSAPIPEHSHHTLYSALVISLCTTAVLLAVVVVLIYHPLPSLTSPVLSSPPSQTSPPPVSSVQSQVQQVTPQPINSRQNLDQAAQTLDATDLSQISTGLNQNSQNTSTFSP